MEFQGGRGRAKKERCLLQSPVAIGRISQHPPHAGSQGHPVKGSWALCLSKGSQGHSCERK